MSVNRRIPRQSYHDQMQNRLKNRIVSRAYLMYHFQTFIFEVIKLSFHEGLIPGVMTSGERYLVFIPSYDFTLARRKQMKPPVSLRYINFV